MTCNQMSHPDLVMAEEERRQGGEERGKVDAEAVGLGRVGLG